MNFVKGLIAFSLIFIISCAAAPIRYSGFLNDYDSMVPSKVVEGLLVEKSANKDIGDYDVFYIEPVVVHLSDQAKGERVDPKKLEELAEYFRNQAINALKQKYTVADEPVDGALLIRAAITDVVANKPYFNLHWSTTLAGFGLGGASMEVEFVDVTTKERILAVVDARRGKRSHYTKGLTKWGHTEDVINMWIKLLTDQLALLHQN